MEVAAAMVKADLENGADAVWIRMACDQGVRVLTAGDVETVLGAVDLRKNAVHFESLSDVLLVSAAYFAIAQARGVPLTELRGGLGADPLATLAETGTLPDGYEAAARTMTELAHYCQQKAPGVRGVCVSTRPYADAGATATQELAYAIATVAEYMRRLIGSGLERGRRRAADEPRAVGVVGLLLADRQAASGTPAVRQGGGCLRGLARGTGNGAARAHGVVHQDAA
jgi:methylmalonyl-CoA mutase